MRRLLRRGRRGSETVCERSDGVTVGGEGASECMHDHERMFSSRGVGLGSGGHGMGWDEMGWDEMGGFLFFFEHCYWRGYVAMHTGAYASAVEW